MKRQRIEQMLPAVVQATLEPGSPLDAVLQVMEGLQEPSEAVLSSLEERFDPRRAPADFVPYLASWVDLDHLFDQGAIEHQRAPESIETGHLRELVAMATYLSRWRGTEKGLISFLEIATGLSGFSVDERVPDPQGRPRPFHIRVRAPSAAAEKKVLLEQIIEREKPAYVTYELMLEDQASPGSP